MRTAERPVVCKFRAFISYSHEDRDLAEWLHGALERYRVPRELVGRETRKTCVPRVLGPIFIDRFELVAGALSDQIKAALHASEHLIVVCSPDSRASKYVAEEIAEFKRLGRANNILALIVKGRPFQTHQDCFPSALTHRGDRPSKEGTEGDADLLAADVDADGRHLAILKLVAGLLGVELDELRRRDALAERRRRRMWTSVAGAMSVLALAAVGLALFAYQQKGRAETNFQLADQRHEKSVLIALRFAQSIARSAAELHIPSDSARDLLNESEKVLTELSAVAGSQELAWRIKAEMELRGAETAARSGDAMKRWQHADAAREAYGKLHAYRPGSVEYRKGLGDASYQAGFALRERGFLAQALKAFEEARTVHNELVTRSFSDDGNASASTSAHRRDLSAVVLEMAIVLRRQGQIDEAMKLFKDALSLRREIELTALNDPAVALDVTIALVEYADALGIKGDIQDRVHVLGGVVEAREMLFRLTKGDAKHKRFLAWAHIFYGEALLENGDSARALELCREAHRLMRDVLASDPNSLVAQKDMAWAEGHLGDALLAVGRIDEAIAGYDRALLIAQGALKTDKISLAPRRNVAYWLSRRGKAFRAKLEIGRARTDLDQAVEFLKKDTSVDESNRQLRSELGIAYLERGRVAWQANQPAVASEFFMKAKMTLEAISAEAPQAKAWTRMADEAGREFLASCRSKNDLGVCVAGWHARATDASRN
jgi:tetratricopeptide (TPR) repeat protein